MIKNYIKFRKCSRIFAKRFIINDKISIQQKEEFIYAFLRYSTRENNVEMQIIDIDQNAWTMLSLIT